MEPIQIAELFDRHAGALELYATTWTHHGADCVQEAFIAIAKEPLAPQRPVAWLYKVVRNRALNSLRATDRRRKHEAATEFLHANRLLDPAITAEMHDRDHFIRVQLGQLTQAERELIVARIWGGLTWREIAELTGIPKSSAERHYNAALSHFKKRLESSCTNDLL